MASILPKTLNVTVAVKRLPKVWDPVLRYQTPNGPSTGRLKLVVSSLRSLLLGSTNGVNVNAIASVANDMRGHVTLKLRNRKETLAVSQPYAHLFRQM